MREISFAAFGGAHKDGPGFVLTKPGFTPYLIYP